MKLIYNGYDGSKMVSVECGLTVEKCNCGHCNNIFVHALGFHTLGNGQMMSVEPIKGTLDPAGFLTLFEAVSPFLNLQKN